MTSYLILIPYLDSLATINVYKCLYKFGIGDINVWMLDSINVWMLDRRLVLYVGVLGLENKLFSDKSEPLSLATINVYKHL